MYISHLDTRNPETRPVGTQATALRHRVRRTKWYELKVRRSKLLIAFALVVGLAACGQSGDVVTEAPPESTESVVETPAETNSSDTETDAETEVTPVEGTEDQTSIPTKSTDEASDEVSEDSDETAESELTVPPQEFDGERCLDVGSDRRCYLLMVPPTAGDNPPVIIDMHGYTGDARGQRAVSGFDELATDEGVIMVWPEGIDGSFNAGICCGTAVTNSTDDVSFLRAIVADLNQNVAATDPNQQFLTGLSNGCAMTQRAAAEASDLFDGAACMSYYLLTEVPPDYSPIPVMELHGEFDAVVAYSEEGIGLSDLLGVELGARTNIEQWAERNGCGAASEQEHADFTHTVFDGCIAPTELVSVPLGAHLLYDCCDTSVDTTALAWDFLFNRAAAADPS